MADDFDPYYTWLGIPPKDQPPTHYRLLGVELFESNGDVIENAADRQMAHVRLFQNGPQGDISQKLLNEITSAKLCLLSPAKRAEYDQQLRAAKQAAEEAARPHSPRAVRSTAKSRPIAPADPTMPFDETEDIVSTPGASFPSDTATTPVFGVATAETSPLPKRRNGNKQLLMIGAGVVSTVCLGVLLFVAFRGGGQAQTASGAGNAGAGNSTASVDPATVGPAKKSSGDDGSHLPVGKSPPIEGKKTPAIGSKTVEPGKTPKSGDPIPGLPAGSAGAIALRFVERNYVDLTGTAENLDAPEPPLTAEMWVRVNPTRSRTYLMGNIAVSRVHPSAPTGVPSGWALSHTHNAPFGNGAEQSGLRLQVGGKQAIGVQSEMDEGWHHVAVCREPSQSEMFYRVYLDGRMVLKTGVPPESRRPSPANLAIGCPPYQPTSNLIQTDIACNAMRVSSVARYQDAFRPAIALEGDAQTVSLLDFSKEQSGELADRVNRGHAGRVFGARWVSAAGLLPAAGPAVNFFTSINFDRDAVGGKWTLAGPTGLPPDRLDLLTPSGGALLRLMDQTPPEYDLELTARRREGSGDLTVGLVSGDRRVALTCDADSGKYTRFQKIETGTPTFDGRLFVVNQAVNLVIQVRTGQLVVLANGKSLLDWRGDASNLSMLPGLVSAPTGKGLFLAAQDGSFRIDKLELRASVSGSATSPPAIVYLDDLTEEDSSVGWGKLGKHGDRGYAEGTLDKVLFREKPYAHALSMHPPPSGKAHVTYRLNRQYAGFQATVALMERPGWEKAGSPLRFRVLGDDKVLWQSSAIQAHGTSQECAVNVAGVAVLKLEVESPEINHGAHAVWLTPMLTPPGAAPSVTYLDDIAELDTSVGLGKLGKRGDRGYDAEGGKVSWKGQRYSHALSMVPPSRGKAYATYRLDRQYREFRANAVLMEVSGSEKAGSPLTFRVLGDDKLLWQSRPLQTPGTGQLCTANVTGVAVLKLEIECLDSNNAAHTAWLMPLVSRTPSKTQPPKPKPSTEPPAVVKSAPPTDEALSKLVESVHQTFAADYAKAKTPDDRLKLAEKLIKESSQPSLDAGSRYALLFEARQLAADTGSVAQASAAIGEIVRNFDVSPATLSGALWGDTLTRAAKGAKTNEARRDVALACVEQAPSAFKAEQYEVAEAMLVQAANLVAQRDNQLARRARDLAKQCTQAKDRLAQSNAAKETLAATADDAKAHLARGKYLCFVRDDWTTGIEHLAKAGDDPLAKIAQRDQAAPAEGKDQEFLGEAWATYAKTAPVGFDRDGTVCRAVYWYFKAWASSEGLAKTRVSQKVEELADKLVASESFVPRTPWLEMDRTEPRRWKAHKGGGGDLSVSRDGMQLATFEYGEPVRLWHVASGRLLREFPVSQARFLALSPDGRLLATNGPKYSIAVWDTQTGKSARGPDYAGINLRDIRFSEDGQWLIFAAEDRVEICDAKTGRNLKRFDSTIGYCVQARVSPDRRWLAIYELGTRGNNGRDQLRLIEIASGKQLPVPDGSLEQLSSIAFSPDGRTAALAGRNGAYTWNLADGKQMQAFSTRFPHSVSYSGDGRRLLVASFEALDIRRTDGGPSVQIQAPGFQKAVLTHDGRAAIGLDRNGEVQIWRVPD